MNGRLDRRLPKWTEMMKVWRISDAKSFINHEPQFLVMEKVFFFLLLSRQFNFQTLVLLWEYRKMKTFVEREEKIRNRWRHCLCTMKSNLHKMNKILSKEWSPLTCSYSGFRKRNTWANNQFNDWHKTGHLTLISLINYWSISFRKF